MPKPIAVQLYSLREQAAKDFVDVLKTVARIGYVGVEFAGLHNRSAKEIRRVIDGEGLKPCSAHVPLFEKAKWNQFEEDARELGYSHLVCPWLPSEVFDSEEKIREAAAKLNEAVNHFEPRGFKISYHNHDWEFTANKGELFYSLAPKAGLEIDIYWVQTAGENPAEQIRRYGRRVSLLHVKDGPCEKKAGMTAVGKGKVDISGAIRAAEYGSLEWNIVEIDRCDTDMVEAIRESYNYLVGRGLAAGRW